MIPPQVAVEIFGGDAGIIAALYASIRRPEGAWSGAPKPQARRKLENVPNSAKHRAGVDRRSRAMSRMSPKRIHTTKTRCRHSRAGGSEVCRASCGHGGVRRREKNFNRECVRQIGPNRIYMN